MRVYVSRTRRQESPPPLYHHKGGGFNILGKYTERARMNNLQISTKKKHQTLYTSFRCFTNAILLIGLFSGCSFVSVNHVDWVYIIPDQYEGWIAIQYECKDGVPLEEKEDVIEVVFGTDGIFCTTDSQFSSRGQIIARNTSGTPIPYYHDNRGQAGYGVCCINGLVEARGIGDNQTTIIVDLIRVGDMQQGHSGWDIFLESMHSR